MKQITIHPFANTGSRYTMVDNYLFDQIMPSIKPNSWKVLSFILRKTSGWHKNEDQLSYSQIREGTGISSQSTVQAALKELVDRTLIIQSPGETKWEAFAYSLNRSFTATISVTEPSTEIVTEPSTISVNTKERSKDSLKKKDLPSAGADFSRPISLLSEKEVKALKLPLSDWKQYLADEQAERNRKGVIDFIEKKITLYELRPEGPNAEKMFELLEREYKNKGRRPPTHFPTTICKENFNAASVSLNGIFETALRAAIGGGIIAIPKIVRYISSPKWQEGNRGQTRIRGTEQKTISETETPSEATGSIPLGSGQTKQMRDQLKAHFGGS